MPEISHAFAFANNEVAFVAWELDVNPLPECLGFHIVREHLDSQDQVVDERPLAAYVAFKGQSNPAWMAQNTSVWPVQKFTWRDLTLRRRRNEASVRPANERVRYRIRAVGKMRDGLEAVETIPSSHRERETGNVIEHAYEGKPIPLGYLTPATRTNIVTATAERGPFTSTFTNGVLSTQFLLRALMEDGKVEDGELLRHLETPDDWLRNYLAGDVITTIREFFGQGGGRFFAALYELEDDELLEMLKDVSDRLDLILSDAGSAESEGEDGVKTTSYDSRNQPARKALRKLARAAGPDGFKMQDRMFNGSGHIGHNKFVIWVDDDGVPQAVLTGSTNWTSTGVAGQSNNCIVIRDSEVAKQFLVYWDRLLNDVQPTPKPLTAAVKGGGQGDALKEENRTPGKQKLAVGSVETWFSPNVPGKNQPPSPKAKTPSPPPPDMARVFSLMRKARRAIFFLVFMPSRGGVNSIVSEAVALGQKDPTLLVTGAISDTQAMWGYQPGKKDDDGNTPSFSPHVFTQGGVSVVRATALADRKLIKELGDFQLAELLTVGRAIIHDKVLVLDPMDPENCAVVFGSHNLGYKASYSNDENLVIVRGQQDLALAYTAHVLDVFDHYRFRAVEMAKSKKEKDTAARRKAWTGFLAKTDKWQEMSSHRLSRYFTS